MRLINTTNYEGFQCKAVISPSGFEITEPDVSECGRFAVDPMEYYGLTVEETAFLRQQAEILARLHELYDSLPNDDHARNFDGWNEIIELEENLK